MSESNRAKGQSSKDLVLGNDIVEFINRNATPYPVDVGGPKFDLVPVEQQKDIMLNVARMHAKQEYDRIMQLVSVLQQQAQLIQQRLDITEQVHAAKYNFQLHHGQKYWLLYDDKDHCTRLTQIGPNDWSTGKPSFYRYICQVQWLGDHTWIEVEGNNGG